MPTTEACKRLHLFVDGLPTITAPRHIKIPDGLYFHQDSVEHSACVPSIHRVIRCGSHEKPGRLKARAWEHNTQNSNGSSFIKHVGSSLINRDYPNETGHFKHWGSISASRCEFCKKIVASSKLFIRGTVLKVAGIRVEWEKAERIAIEILAHCEKCRPGPVWLGRHCENVTVKEGRLWNDEHVEFEPVPEDIEWFFEQTHLSLGLRE